MNNNLTTAIIVLTVIGSALFLSTKIDAPNPFGSVSVSNEYIATSTSEGLNGIGTADVTVLRASAGTLGSVVISGAAAGQIILYDATTTDNQLRASVATSSIILADLPASTVAGTYTYDVQFTNGLLFEIIGIQPTSTITYR